jgi:hypothetical protein
MDINSGSIGRLVANELPGLLGALQPAAGAAQNIGQIARRQSLANAMLAAAAGLLTPSSNRYPLGPLQRLGAGLGAALESLDAAPAPLAMFQTPGGNTAPGEGAAMEGAARKQGRVFALSKVAARSDGARQRPSSAPRRTASGGPRLLGRPGRPVLRKFNGALGRRLEHPAVLPGGWQLYGYEAKSGHPVYAGPGRELRVYLDLPE